MAELALGFQFLKSFEYFALPKHGGGRTVQLEQVQGFRLEAAQTRLNAAGEVWGGEILLFLSGAHLLEGLRESWLKPDEAAQQWFDAFYDAAKIREAIAGLGCDHDFIQMAFERLAQQRFAGTLSIYIGRVEKIDPAVQTLADQAQGRLVAAGLGDRAKARATQPEGRHLEARSS